MQQSDFHLPSLTVFETLQYHADLRMPPSTSAEMKHDRVLYVARILALNECLHVRVGNEELKGISGVRSKVLTP